MNHSISQAVAAQIVGVTPRRLQQMHTSGDGPPRNDDSSYPAIEFGKWLHDRIAAQCGVDTDGTVIDYGAERARLTKEQADAAELGNLKSRGELVDAYKVSQFFSDVATATKNRLRSLPTKVGPRVKGMNAAQATEEIRAGVDEALTEVGRRFIEI